MSQDDKLSLPSIDELDNNCTHLAVREVTGAADADILREYLKVGWKPGEGEHVFNYRKILQALGAKIWPVPTDDLYNPHVEIWVKRRRSPWEDWEDGREMLNPARFITLKEFLRRFQRGTFIVGVDGHALVVRDGRIIDLNMRSTRTSRRVKSATQIMNPAPTRVGHLLQSYQLQKGEDPMVQFVGLTTRGPSTAARRREFEAQSRAGNKPIRLSVLLRETSYTRRDAAWDLRTGRLVVIPEPEEK